MIRPLLISFVLLCSFGLVLAGNDKDSKQDIKPDTAAASAPVRLVTFSADSSINSDTIQFARGDSIFIFDGELYYRAQANGQEFFISRNQLLPLSDSLVIYQNYRLINRSAAKNAAVDSIDQKVVRTRCTAVNKDGTRCRRLALPGQTKCWQHKT